MANKLYNDTSIKAIANAIRAKNGKTDTYTVAEMAGAINDIPVGGGVEQVEWHQCPEAVRNYLDYVAEHPYTEDNPDVTYINNFAPATADVMTNTKPIAETVTGQGYRNEVPNVDTPFSTATMAGTLKPLDKLRWINTTPLAPAEGESYARGKNTRDLGGWSCDGGTVKYGVLIRGSEPNPADKELMVDEIGIKTEVQLLPLSEQTEAYRMKSAWGIDWRGNDTNDSVYGLENPTLLVKIIRDIIDSVTHDKPVYFHCGIGADRTGFIAIVLEAVLGVSRCDIDTDYELTDFSQGWQELEGGIYRSRSYVTHKSLMEEIYAVPLVGGLTSSFRNHIISYLIANGMTIGEINAFRSACIDGTPTDITVALSEYTVTNTLQHATSNNPATKAIQYSAYEAEITPSSGHVISSVTVLMDGADITNLVVDGDISAPRGSKVITENGKTDVSFYKYADVNVPSITPTGTIQITDTSVVDVTNYANAQVVDSDLIPANIKKDINILGVIGTFEGGGSAVNAKIFTFSSPAPVANQNVKIVSADPDVAAHYADPNAMVTVRKITNNSSNGLAFLMNSNHTFGTAHGVYMNFNTTGNAASPITNNLVTEIDSISVFCNSSGDIFVHCKGQANNFGGADYLITFTW